MRHASSLWTTGLLVLGLAASPRAASAQASAADRQQRPPAPAGEAPVVPTSTPAEFVVGKQVYLRSTGTRIGVIEKADSAHVFPSWMSRKPLRAVLIHRKDGPMEWVAVDRITRIYVVDR
ncbi:MAG: hypothetical protein JWN79_2306 [Gemmatimonadetes bacterium]|jgi:hypothetical protein|nr:hypothetical protein [Gemmatimonadota bacterium]